MSHVLGLLHWIWHTCTTAAAATESRKQRDTTLIDEEAQAVQRELLYSIDSAFVPFLAELRARIALVYT
jgi:hypothetical protein